MKNRGQTIVSSGESMRRSIIKTIYIVIDFFCPSILAVFLIAQYGLVWICAILALEWLQILLTNRIVQIPYKSYDWWKVTLSSIGIAVGALLFPVKSTPYELGIAVTVLASVIHLGLYMIMSSFIRKQ